MRLGWLVVVMSLLWLPVQAQDDGLIFGGDVFYLAPDEAGVVNVHGMALHGEPMALTSAEIDLYYYDVAPDGRFIVYAMRAERGGASDIMRLEADGTLERLTDCRAHDIDCRRPVISPDGERIAYERMVMNGGAVPAVPDAPQIWVWQAGEHRLIAEGVRPAWHGEGVLVYESLQDAPNATSTPSGQVAEQGAYLALDDGRMRVYVWRDSPDEASALDDEGEHTYTAITPSPDGRWLILERYALRGYGLPQLMLYDMRGGTMRLLAYGHSARWRTSLGGQAGGR